jgi:hypothetical protein
VAITSIISHPLLFVVGTTSVYLPFACKARDFISPRGTLISIVLIKFAVLTDPAYARWATYDDADLKTEFYNENLIINKDGTTEAVIEIQQDLRKTYFWNS